MTEIIDKELTDEELEDREQYAAEQPERERAAVAEARRAAYAANADPLFFEAERGLIEKQVWLDKCAEIKKRLPYPPEGEQ